MNTESGIAHVGCGGWIRVLASGVIRPETGVVRIYVGRTVGCICSGYGY